MRICKNWIKEEDDLIREKYPELGAQGLMKFIVGRSQHSVVDRAHRLRVKWNRPSRRRRCQN